MEQGGQSIARPLSIAAVVRHQLLGRQLCIAGQWFEYAEDVVVRDLGSLAVWLRRAPISISSWVGRAHKRGYVRALRRK